MNSLLLHRRPTPPRLACPVQPLAPRHRLESSAELSDYGSRILWRFPREAFTPPFEGDSESS
eukprot:3869921-Alexandrium_andersonii.AAC.1